MNIPTLTKHPNKPNTYVDEDGVEWIFRITNAEEYGYGFLDDAGIMHEYVKKSATDEIVRERHTPMRDWTI
jgi:hypothetical protein